MDCHHNYMEFPLITAIIAFLWKFQYSHFKAIELEGVASEVQSGVCHNSEGALATKE